MTSRRPNKEDLMSKVKKNENNHTAVKVVLAVVGIGLIAGTTLVLGMDRIMKTIFVNEDWPAEEWSNDDWAEEDLEA